MTTSILLILLATLWACTSAGIDFQKQSNENYCAYLECASKPKVDETEKFCPKFQQGNRVWGYCTCKATPDGKSKEGWYHSCDEIDKVFALDKNKCVPANVKNLQSCGGSGEKEDWIDKIEKMLPGK